MEFIENDRDGNALYQTSFLGEDMIKRPETIELWLQMTGNKLFWWEPFGVAGFKVCTVDDDKYILFQNGSEVTSRRCGK